MKVADDVEEEVSRVHVMRLFVTVAASAPCRSAAPEALDAPSAFVAATADLFFTGMTRTRRQRGRARGVLSTQLGANEGKAAL